MAETEFLLIPDTQKELLGFFLSNGLVFVPSMHFDSPRIRIADTIEELEDVIDSLLLTGPVFLPKSSQRPFRFKFGHYVRDKKKVYFIEQRLGFPVLAFLPSELKKNPEKPLITSGFISYYPTYYIDDKYNSVKVPDWIVLMYKEIKAFLRTKCKLIKSSKRSYLIDKNLIPLIGVKYIINVPNLDL